MKPSDFKTLVTSFIQNNIKRAIHVQSSPGVGKTQIVGQVAKELGIGFKFIHAPLLQPEDYGFPVISPDKTDVNFIVSRDKFPIVGSECPETGILLIDELPQADNSAQKILTNLLQEREIHGKQLKPGWNIVTTGNRASDRAGANRLLSHLSNKIVTIELEPSIDDWTQWALNNNVKTEVIAFIRFRPELLNSFDTQHEINPTPRSWSEGISAALGVIPSHLEFETFKGNVGEAAAAEFMAFLKVYRSLPSVDVILLNPATATLPSDPATVYALCGALVNKTTKDNFARIMEYVKRMAPEFSVLFIRDVTRKNPELQNTKEFITWASSDGAKLIA